MIESVKKAFILSIKALKLFYVIAAANIIANIINLLVIPTPVNVEMTLGRSLLVLALTILFSLIAIFIGCGTLAHIKELIKAGSANLTSFISNGKKYFLRFLCISLVILSVLIILSLLLSRILGPLPGALRFILMPVVFIALIVFLTMIPCALVGSDLGIGGSIKNGVLMGKKHFFKILGIILIMSLIYIGLLIIAALIIGPLALVLRPISNFIAAILIAIINAVMVVLANIAYMDFYLKSVESAQ